MLQKTPTKGMRDFLPSEFSIRQQVLNSIIATYEKHGFLQIETPAVENLQLLNSKQGGDNEKLIYKILKRGEKLEEAQNGGELCDLGLRYDLTVPLSRFTATTVANFPQCSKQFKRVTYGVQIDLNVADIVNSVNATWTSLATAPLWQKLNLSRQLPTHCTRWALKTPLFV